MDKIRNIVFRAHWLIAALGAILLERFLKKRYLNYQKVSFYLGKDIMTDEREAAPAGTAQVEKMNPQKGDGPLHAAFLASFATVVLSPISIWLGFTLTSFLSRASLSLEYVTFYEHKVDSYIGPLLDDAASPKASLSCTPMLKATILNKGSTDGLILSSGEFKLGDRVISAELAGPPQDDADMIAVPTYVVNDTVLGGVSTVGKVPQNSMVEYWFRLTDLACGVADNQRFSVTIFDHERREIKWQPD